jgi:DNA-binding CsgD family transcriptional regulator
VEQGRDALAPVVRLLGLLDTRPVHGASLTSAEQEVVRLVMAGPTNPEIGKRLFMSRSTVKTHLAHVFAKLGVAVRLGGRSAMADAWCGARPCQIVGEASGEEGREARRRWARRTTYSRIFSCRPQSSIEHQRRLPFFDRSR